jgi:putative phosphoribosyl transferase
MVGTEFFDRREAGRLLGQRLAGRTGPDPVVLGLPRGGVPVAYEVARALAAPLDVIVVRKLGVPGHRELAMGAIGEGGVRVLETAVLRSLRVGEVALRRTEQRERAVLEARVATLRRRHPRVGLAGRTALVVDDGMATGSTARAACAVAGRLGAERVVLAVPVAPIEAVRTVGTIAEVVCLACPDPFLAVGNHYHDFTATSEQEVMRLLDAASTAPQ